MGCLFQARKRKCETFKQQTKGKLSKENSVGDNSNQPPSNENNDFLKDNEEDQKEITEDFVGTRDKIGTGNEACSLENTTNETIGENAGYVENVSGSANEILDSLHPNVLPAGTTETVPASQEQSICSEMETSKEIELKGKNCSGDPCIDSDGYSELPKLCEETLADKSCSNGCDQTEVPASSGTNEEKVGECLTAKNEECCVITPSNYCEMLEEAPSQLVKIPTGCAGGNEVLKTEDIPHEVDCKSNNFEEEKITRPSVPNTNAKGLQCTDIENNDQCHQTLDQESLSKIEPSRCEMKDNNLDLNESKGLVIDREHGEPGDETVEKYLSDKEQMRLDLELGNIKNALATVLENAPSCVPDRLENEGQMNKLLDQKADDMSISSSDNFEEDNEIGLSKQDKIDVVMFDQFENNNVPEPSKPEVSKIFVNLLKMKMKKKITLYKPLSAELKPKNKETSDGILPTNNYCSPSTNQSHLPIHTEESDPGLLSGTKNSHETELNESSSHRLPVVENSSSKEFAIEKPILRNQLRNQLLIPFLKKSYFPEDKECATPSPVYKGCDSSPSPVSEKYSSKEDINISPCPSPTVEDVALDAGNFSQESIKNSSADIYKRRVLSLTSPTYSEVTASTSSMSISPEQTTSIDFQDLGGDSDNHQSNRHPSVISISDDSDSTDCELGENKRKKRSKSPKNLNRKHSYYKGKKDKKKHSDKKSESESGSIASNYYDVVSEIIKSSSLMGSSSYNEVNGRESETLHGKNKVCMLFKL